MDVDDGDALFLATCKRSEKGATLGRAMLPAGLRTGLTALFYGAINMIPLNAFRAFSVHRALVLHHPAANNKALSD